MSKKLVADLIVDYLERRDVEYVFGLCGHTVIGMLDALSRSKKLKFVNTRHEAIASTAADGYARVAHKASAIPTKRCRCTRTGISTKYWSLYASAAGVSMMWKPFPIFWTRHSAWLSPVVPARS